MTMLLSMIEVTFFGGRPAFTLSSLSWIEYDSDNQDIGQLGSVTCLAVSLQ